jgi:pimeloyl-ACP methyl ester carboxylesterase
LTAQADRIAFVLDRLDVTHAVLLAHTVGASMAYRLAYRRPDLVGGVVSLDGGPAEEAATPGFKRALRYIPWLKWFGGLGLIRKKVHEELVRDSHDTTWVTDAVVSGFTAGPERDLSGSLKAYVAMGQSRESVVLKDHLAEIHCPVLMVIGASAHHGGIGPDELGLMGMRVARFSIDSVPEAGLYVYAEQPQAVLAAVRWISAAGTLGAATVRQ